MDTRVSAECKSGGDLKNLTLGEVDELSRGRNKQKRKYFLPKKKFKGIVLVVQLNFINEDSIFDYLIHKK